MSKRTTGGCWDITDQMDTPETHSAFSLFVSGKSGYKAVIERKKDQPKCKNCNAKLDGSEKFCPECGNKIESANSSSQNKPTV